MCVFFQIKMLKNDSHLSAREVNNENWARVRKGWTKRSTLERSLFLVTCGLVVFMLVMFPVLHILNADHAKQGNHFNKVITTNRI